MDIPRTAIIGMKSSRGSHDSMMSGSYGFSVSPTTSTTSEETHNFQNPQRHPSISGSHTMDANSNEDENDLKLHAQESRFTLQEHVIHLSSIEHCMPRAYIRVCLAFRLPKDTVLEDVISRLRKFVRKLVDSKPYLSGYVVPVARTSHTGLVEIRYTDRDFCEFPEVHVRHLSADEVPFTYDQLNENCLPPSTIKPHLVSALPEGTDDHHAPVFRMQANVVEGGLIVSVYLHHCISDGAGLGLLVTGSVLQDDFTFERHLELRGYKIPSLDHRLSSFAKQKSDLRQKLSWSLPDQISNRHIEFKRLSKIEHNNVRSRPPSRGCVIAFSRSKLANLRIEVKQHIHNPKIFITDNDVLQTLLWHHMTRARKPSIDEQMVSVSKLLIPVNIRSKLNERLPESYFGAAVDFACAQMPIHHLATQDDQSLPALAETALTIRNAILKVDDRYIRQVIALAQIPDPDIDVRDLMGSNMNRATGADMYITSWEKLGLYNATLEMGLGRPDWVRKPWSKDPGSCIILPSDDRKDYLEVVVQMTAADMERLLADQNFMKFVTRVVD